MAATLSINSSQRMEQRSTYSGSVNSDLIRCASTRSTTLDSTTRTSSRRSRNSSNSSRSSCIRKIWAKVFRQKSIISSSRTTSNASSSRKPHSSIGISSQLLYRRQSCNHLQIVIIVEYYRLKAMQCTTIYYFNSPFTHTLSLWNLMTYHFQSTDLSQHPFYLFICKYSFELFFLIVSLIYSSFPLLFIRYYFMYLYK